MIVEYSFIIAVIPVILVVAFLVWIAKKITDGERLDMKEGVLGVVILMVAVLIMVPMVSSTQVYTWDEDTGELVIQQNISGGSYAWDTYDSQIRSIVIKPGVTQIGNSAFDGAVNIEYLSIPDTVTDIGTNAFGVTVKDYLDQSADIEAGEYVGTGNGTIYRCDSSIFSYTANGKGITGMASGAGTPIALVIPTYNGAEMITSINTSAFANNADLVFVSTLPDSGLTTLQYGVFASCSSLSYASMPTVREIGDSVFYNCTALSNIDLPVLTNIGKNTFLTSGLETFSFANTITNIGINGFRGIISIESVTFATGFDATLGSDWAQSWTFYASDGTTVIDKTVAANLAGKTFQGTASALVEVEPGLLSLTPQQIQQVQLHTQELQDLKDQISIEPLPLQPSLQEQELTA